MTKRSTIRVATSAVFLALTLAVLAAPDANKYKLKPGATGKACLGCHVDFEETVAQPFVHTPVKAGNCADCHDPHASDHGKLLETDPKHVCAGCHSDLVPEKALSVHAPVSEGDCVKCHDPHASKNKSALRESGNDLCKGCHQDVAAAAATASFKHAPAERDCLGCHTPHASSTSRSLLAKPVPDLCVGCHNAKLPLFAKAHSGYPVEKARCTSCHDPHGSGNDGILWASVHRPVASRMCAQCHEDASTPAALGTKKAGAELCRGCHNDLYNETFSKNRIHWPLVDTQACANCHAPHAAKTAPLLVESQKVLCGGCHGDVLARLDRSVTKHAPVVEGECATCHTPHSSNGAYLLASESVMDVCGTCHDWQTHSTHPIGEKVRDQRNPNLTLDCLSCHRSHGTPFEHMAHADPKSDLCTQCHAELSR